MSYRKRIAGIFTAVIISLGLSVAVAGSASAETEDCLRFLRFHDYALTEEHVNSCVDGEYGYLRSCYKDLRGLGVSSWVAGISCDRAYWL